MTLAERVAADFGNRFRSFGDRAPGRFVEQVAGLTIVSVGVDQPWGVQIIAMERPVDAVAVASAVEWCRGRGHEPQVRVQAAERGALPDYPVAEEVPALVAAAGGEQSLLEIVRAADLEEFREVYATSFGMDGRLAAGLVVAADLDAHPHLLGRVDGRVVACAQVRPGSDMAYVSGVGVLPTERGRGYGAAMLAACRIDAADRGCELVWLNASATSVGFYEAIGFELVDIHLALTAP